MAPAHTARRVGDGVHHGHEVHARRAANPNVRCHRSYRAGGIGLLNLRESAYCSSQQFGINPQMEIWKT